jgi:hypothetical protein
LAPGRIVSVMIETGAQIGTNALFVTAMLSSSTR